MGILEELKKGIVVDSPEKMERMGRRLAREFHKGGIIGLKGDLGAGKTTLVRGMARELGIPEITSPSFNYYFLHKGKIPLLHLDAYRLNSPAEYPSLMIDELLTPKNLFVIEWPEKLGSYLPKDTLLLELKIISPGIHNIRML